MENNNQLQLAYFLLSTEDASKISFTEVIGENKKLILTQKAISESCGYTPQHIYLCSNREIKEGDWVKSPTGNIHKAYQQCTTNKCLKIEFATDPKLTNPTFETGKISEWDKLVPAIDGETKVWIINPDELSVHDIIEVNFLEEFCKRWNENNETKIEEKEAIHKSNTQRYNHNQKDNPKMDVEKLTSEYIAGEVLNGLKNVPLIHLDKAFKAGLQSNAGGFSLEDMKAMAIQVSDWKDGYVGKSDARNLETVISEFLYSLSFAKEQPSREIKIWCELHPRPITVGHTENGEEGKDYEWSVVPYKGKPIIYFK